MICLRFYLTSLQKFLKKTDTGTTSRIIEAIEKLADDPISHDLKRIIGHAEKLFRIRAGKFRILYRGDYTNHTIVIINYIQ
uniref:Type II toxin-antitoxin system RelE/ParE family toxin n=1 Tax=Candidatus Methanogaster sp. ANME-2c ERB4 TaxID=2759911 RepID=A0A7G9YI90_9EURY|nr:hypothetical protein LDJELIEA_00022 [Methanosarcinales archaeon ANME-2c ERB4]